MRFTATYRIDLDVIEKIFRDVQPHDVGVANSREQRDEVARKREATGRARARDQDHRRLLAVRKGARDVDGGPQLGLGQRIGRVAGAFLGVDGSPRRAVAVGLRVASRLENSDQLG